MIFYRYYVRRYFTYESNRGEISAVSPDFSNLPPEEYVSQFCPVQYKGSDNKQYWFNYIIRAHEISESDYDKKNKFSVPIKEFIIEVT